MPNQIVINLNTGQHKYQVRQLKKKKINSPKNSLNFHVLNNILQILKTLFILNFLNFLPKVQTVSSVPFTYKKLPLAQSLKKDCIISNPSTTYVSTYNVQYSYERVNMPNKIFYGIYEFKYDINFKHSDNKYHLNFTFDISGITNSSFTFTVFSPQGTLQIVKVSFFILFTGFRYSSLFQIHQLVFSSNGIIGGGGAGGGGGGGNQTYVKTATLGFDYSNAKILPLLTHCQIKSDDGKFRLYHSHTQGSSSNMLSAEMKFESNNFYNISLIMRYLVIDYVALNYKNNQVSLFYYNYDKSSSSSLSMPFTNYSDPYSYKIFGLVYFQYDAKNNGQNMFNFQFTSSDSNTSISFTLDNDFNKLTFSLIVITFKMCQDFKQYPIIWKNTTSGNQYCNDSCSDGYYMVYSLSSNFYNCSPCNQQCETCDQLNQCITCKIQYEKNLSGACVMKKSYFISPSNSSIINPCTFNSNLSNCLQCQTNGYYCQQCNISYYKNSSNLCSPCNSIFPNCSKCTSSSCLECSSSLTLLNQTFCGISNSSSNSSSNNTQLPCVDPRCAYCSQSTLNICLHCNDTNLTIKNGKCVQNCGDGIIYGLQLCDDRNNLDYDGCSSDCWQVENGYICLNLPSSPNIQKCVFVGSINLTPVSITKEKRQNKIKIVLKNSVPNLLVWQKFDKNSLKRILQLKVPKFQSNLNAYTFDYQVSFISYSPNGPTRLLQTTVFTPSLYQYLLVQILYLSSSTEAFSFNNLLLQIQFHPSLTNASTFYVNNSLFTPSSSVQLTLQSEDNFLLQYFSSAYYENCSKVEGFSLVISIMSIIMILVAIAAQFLEGVNAKQMIITIQTTCIVQFTYFSLLGIGPLNPMFAAMAQGLKYTSGFDINLDSTKSRTKQLLAMNIESGNIEGNVNISVIIPLLFVFFGLIILWIKKLNGQKNKTQEQNYVNVQNIQKKQPQEQPQKKYQMIKNQQNSQSLLKKPQNLIANFGFCLFLFFLYKYFVFTLIQVTQNMDQLQFTGVLIIGLFGFLLLFFICTLFMKFQLYQNMAQKISYNKPLPISQQTVLRNYFLFYILERLINSFSITVLGSLPFNGFISLFIYISKLFFIYKYLQKIYHPSHKLRLYLTYTVGIVISALLITRRLLLDTTITIEGGQQYNYGIYLPYSILPLLFILLAVGITFQIYSIKRIRCCKLDIEWQKRQAKLHKNYKSQKVQNLCEQNYNNSNTLDSSLHQKIANKLQNYQSSSLKNKNILNFISKTYHSNKDNQQNSKEKLSQNNISYQQNAQEQFNSSNSLKKDLNQKDSHLTGLHKPSLIPSKNNSVKRQIKNQLQKVRLTKQGKTSSSMRNKKVSQKSNKHKQLQIQVEQQDGSYFGLQNKHYNGQGSNYKYTNQKRYYYGDEYDMI